MKVSYLWLAKYLEGRAPSPEEIANLLMFHSFEVEGLEKEGDDRLLELAILPNRAHDALCHEGVAKEIALIANLKFTPEKIRPFEIKEVAPLSINIEDSACRRYVGRRIENIEVRQSPDWLRSAIESIGQKSINNIVDATNYVMFAIGQPTHVFSANTDAVIVRKAKEGEQIITLDAKEIGLDPETLIIADAREPLAIAGIKGGKKEEVKNGCKDLILESANFDPALIRKTSRRLSLRTESSTRFENEITPELAKRGMDILTGLIVEIAGTSETKVGEIVDFYPRKPDQYKIGLGLSEASRLLGLKLSEEEIRICLNKLGFFFQKVKVIENVLKLAPQFVGVAYRYGASVTFDAPNYFDCSGFINYLFRQSGVNLPRMAIDQYFFSKRVEHTQLVPGDLVFSSYDNHIGKRYKSIEFLAGAICERGVSHVGIYLGNGEVIHATGFPEKNAVVLEKLSHSSNFKNIMGYGRIVESSDERYVVSPPPERLDLWPRKGVAFSCGTSADLIEEIARVVGLEKITAVEPERSEAKISVNKLYYHMQRAREMLALAGFSEIYGYTFSVTGELSLENPLNKEKPYLRPSLSPLVEKQLVFNKANADLLGLDEIRLFEIGNVFDKKGESIRLAIGSTLKGDLAKLTDYGGRNIYDGSFNILEIDFEKSLESFPNPSLSDLLPVSHPKRPIYSPFSIYPYMVRDIALFVPKETEKDEIRNLIVSQSGPLLKLIRVFDVFDKGSKVSYAFRLVFQSNDRTLKNEEINKIMEKITVSLTKKGWQVR